MESSTAVTTGNTGNSSTGDIQASRGGSRRGQSRGLRGGANRGRRRGGPGNAKAPESDQSQTTSQLPVVLTEVAGSDAKSPEGKSPVSDGDDAEGNGGDCFICANTILYSSVAPCKHVTCHICSLRMRALYKNKKCPHCRVSASPIIPHCHPLTVE